MHRHVLHQLILIIGLPRTTVHASGAHFPFVFCSFPRSVILAAHGSGICLIEFPSSVRGSPVSHARSRSSIASAPYGSIAQPPFRIGFPAPAHNHVAATRGAADDPHARDGPPWRDDRLSRFSLTHRLRVAATRLSGQARADHRAGVEAVASRVAFDPRKTLARFLRRRARTSGLSESAARTGQTSASGFPPSRWSAPAGRHDCPSWSSGEAERRMCPCGSGRMLRPLSVLSGELPARRLLLGIFNRPCDGGSIWHSVEVRRNRLLPIRARPAARLALERSAAASGRYMPGFRPGQHSGVLFPGSSRSPTPDESV